MRKNGWCKRSNVWSREAESGHVGECVGENALIISYPQPITCYLIVRLYIAYYDSSSLVFS